MKYTELLKSGKAKISLRDFDVIKALGGNGFDVRKAADSVGLTPQSIYVFLKKFTNIGYIEKRTVHTKTKRHEYDKEVYAFSPKGEELWSLINE